MDRLQIDMRNLLHTDQEYEYHEDLREGDVPVVETRIADFRERRGMTFVVLESDVRCEQRLVLRTRSSFVVRNSEEPAV